MSLSKIGVIVAVSMAAGGMGYAQGPGNCPAECQMNCPHGGSGPRGGGWMNGPYSRMYDPKTVETIKGEIVSVEYVAPMKGMSEGVHLAVKTDKGEMAVHLGPAWYLDNQDVQLAKGDRVEVHGSRVNIDGRPAIIAANVKKGTETLVLRDSRGLPMWRGWR